MNPPLIHTAKVVCKLFQQWGVTEALPKAGQQVVVNFPPSEVFRLAVVKLSGRKSTYNKPLYVIEFLHELPTTDLRARVQDWAQEAALADLKFSGDAPWRNVTPKQRELLEAALVFYARSAARTIDSLKLHGHLK